jgi:hypothetical protein
MPLNLPPTTDTRALLFRGNGPDFTPFADRYQTVTCCRFPYGGTDRVGSGFLLPDHLSAVALALRCRSESFALRAFLGALKFLEHGELLSCRCFEPGVE